MLVSAMTLLSRIPVLRWWNTNQRVCQDSAQPPGGVDSCHNFQSDSESCRDENAVEQDDERVFGQEFACTLEKA